MIKLMTMKMTVTIKNIENNDRGYMILIKLLLVMIAIAIMIVMITMMIATVETLVDKILFLITIII